MQKAIAGIDLGTTYSCVALLIVNEDPTKSTVEIVKCDELGEQGLTMPSCVAYDDKVVSVGHAARDERNCLYDAKRLIGRTFLSKKEVEEFENLAKKWPFKVVLQNGKPMYVITRADNESQTFSPEEVSAQVLIKLKKAAERKSGLPVVDVVITVPAYFNDSQRHSTKAAATIAGLNTVRMINEPTAAALAYVSDKIKEKKEKAIIVVYDLGGGTFDVSVLEIIDGVVTVKATSGDTNLGGQDFVVNMVDHFVKEIEAKFGKEAAEDESNLRDLSFSCEKAKCLLSSSGAAKILVKKVTRAGEDFKSSITLEKFESMNESLFTKTIDCVKKALQIAEVEPGDVNDIIMVGGASRTPMAEKMVTTFFGKKPNHSSVIPDHAVAIGATIQAGIIAQKFKGLHLCDVTPFSLGIEDYEKKMSTVIKHNSPIACSETQTFYTPKDGIRALDIIVYQGEKEVAKENTFLGRFELSGIAPAPKGQPIEVTFTVNFDGILEVSAVYNKGDGGREKNSITIRKNVMATEIEQMAKEAAKYTEKTIELSD